MLVCSPAGTSMVTSSLTPGHKPGRRGPPIPGQRMDIEALFNKHKLVRRLLLLWAVSLITFVLVAYTENMGKIQAADATVIIGVIGILTTVLTLYQVQRHKEDRDVRP